MLSCGALERSKNPYIEQVVEPCVPKNQEEILAMWIWLRRTSRKSAEAMEKSIHELKTEFMDSCEKEKKN